MSLLSASHVTVLRGGKRILDDVSCSLEAGRVTAVLGPNGAGKSTLLRLFAGEFAPDGGHLSLGGRDLAAWRVAEVARRRSVLPQESGLTFPFRVEEVALMGRAPHVRGVESARDHEIAAEALTRVDMAGKRTRAFPSLSGGEKQRVHLARALAQIWEERGGERGSGSGEQRVLLLDEPTSSLDLAHQHSTLREARRFAAGGVAVLAILHDLNLALAYADDVIVLSQGRVAAAGPVEAALVPECIRAVFGVECRFVRMEGEARPFVHVLPLAGEAGGEG